MAPVPVFLKIYILYHGKICETKNKLYVHVSNASSNSAQTLLGVANETVHADSFVPNMTLQNDPRQNLDSNHHKHGWYQAQNCQPNLILGDMILYLSVLGVTRKTY